MPPAPWYRRSLAGSLVALLGAACAPEEEPALWIATTALPDGRVGFAYSAALEVEDAEGDGAWSLVEGALPAGLELSADGEIAGTCGRSGTFELTVRAEDELGADELDLVLFVPPVLLMSGYGPFVGYEVNPSIEALRGLHETFRGPWDIRVVELPVTWEGAWPPLEAAIAAFGPTVVVSTGVADTDAMRLETSAVNEQKGRDVEGEYPEDDEVVVGGPEELSTGLPVEEMAAAMEAGGHPTVRSASAGTYLCNHLFYRLMYHVACEAPEPFVAGFVHVPAVPDSDEFELADVTGAHLPGIDAITTWMDSGQPASRTRRGTRVAPTYAGG